MELLDETVYQARLTADEPTNILSIKEYDPQVLYTFLSNAADATAGKFAEYAERRRKGGPRELFPTREYALYWLRMAAPVKYVDGSWLGGVHRLNTNPSWRKATRIAWQILSEELGDGDLRKNHVWVYNQLINSIGAGSIGLGHEKRFISNLHNPNSDSQVWRAAISQLCIGMFPEDMLPEMLGFNMSYESLPLHLLVTINELKELNVDPYYFVLHVSIDNGHSGHAAMGAAAVTAYVESFEDPQKKELAWRRVQTGYILSDLLRTTPTPPNDLDKQVERIFGAKCRTAKSMHTFCKGKIGGGIFGKPLSEWLDPGKFENRGQIFVKVLADSRWVKKGSPRSSKLIQELHWGGRMYGAYTTKEVVIVSRWIEEMGSEEMGSEEKPCSNSSSAVAGTWSQLTGISCPSSVVQLDSQEFRQLLPSNASLPFPPSPPPTPPQTHSKNNNDAIHLRSCPNVPYESNNMLPTLLLLLPAVLERIPAIPARSATPAGMAAVRVLRTLYGFNSVREEVGVETFGLCAGMDEVSDYGSSTPPIPDSMVSMDSLPTAVGLVEIVLSLRESSEIVESAASLHHAMSIPDFEDPTPYLLGFVLALASTISRTSYLLRLSFRPTAAEKLADILESVTRQWASLMEDEGVSQKSRLTSRIMVSPRSRMEKVFAQGNSAGVEFLASLKSFDGERLKGRRSKG